MNLYDILNVEESASIKDIRSAYKKLAVKHHPDKVTGNVNIFRDITIAYEVLSDEEKRKEYDKMNSNKQLKLYEMLLEMIPDRYVSITKYFMSYFNIQKDIDNLDIESILFKMYGQHDEKMNIKCSVKVSLIDMYLKKIKKIKVNRIINGKIENKEFNIPILNVDDEYILDFEGDCLDLEKGHLIIDFELEENGELNFYRINEYDLVYTKKITFQEYVEGIQFDLKHLDNNIIKIKIDDPSLLVHCIDNKGLPKSYNNDKMGDLYIHFIIEKNEKMKK
jgi:DnaJ-class molecular chaperone